MTNQKCVPQNKGKDVNETFLLRPSTTFHDDKKMFNEYGNFLFLTFMTFYSSSCHEKEKNILERLLLNIKQAILILVRKNLGSNAHNVLSTLLVMI